MFFNTFFSRINIFYVLLVYFTSSLLLAAEQSPQKNSANYAGHPHCGLYCLYSILKLEGKSVDFRELVKPEYLGSRKGSSFEELKQAAEDFNLHAVSLSNLAPADLKHLQWPTILHVKSGSDQKEYDHFVLYMGNDRGKAVIYDPPGKRTSMEFSRLQPIWGGSALIISSTPLPMSQLSAVSRKRVLVYAALVIMAIAAIHYFKRFVRMPLSSRLRLCVSAGQAACLIIVVVLAGLLGHFFYDGGFFANGPAVEGVQKAYSGAFIPKIMTSKMETIVANKNAVLLDARFERDYEVGHIANAISLPVNCSDETYTQFVSSLPNDKLVVLYCQSVGCKFAENMAIRLKNDGHTKLAVFRGGWVEWEKSVKTQIKGKNNAAEI